MKQLIFSLLIILAGGVFHQTPAQALHAKVMVSELTDSLSNVYHVTRKIPSGFHFIQDLKSWVWGNLWRRDAMNGKVQKNGKTGMVGALLQSDDRQCEVLYDFLFGMAGDLTHRTWIMSDLLSISGGQDNIRYEDYVTVISGREARRRFNADSIFLIDIPIEPLKQDGEVYTHCTRMYLSKRGRNMLGFVWFFTDEGYRCRQKYMDALEGNVAYKKGHWRKPDWIRRMEKAK